MYTSEKNTKQLTVRGGGGNPYGQPDRKISVFFLTASLSDDCEDEDYEDDNTLGRG